MLAVWFIFLLWWLLEYLWRLVLDALAFSKIWGFLQAPTQIWVGPSNTFMQINSWYIGFLFSPNIWGASNKSPPKSGPMMHCRDRCPCTQAHYLPLRVFSFPPPWVITDKRLCLDWTSFQELEVQKGFCKTVLSTLTKPKVREILSLLWWGRVNCRQVQFPYINSKETGGRQGVPIQGFWWLVQLQFMAGAYFPALWSQWGPQFSGHKYSPHGSELFALPLGVFVWLCYFTLWRRAETPWGPEAPGYCGGLRGCSLWTSVGRLEVWFDHAVNPKKEEGEEIMFTFNISVLGGYVAPHTCT